MISNLIELLAQTSVPTGVTIGGAGVGIGGLAWWLIRRDVKKVIAHVENNNVHVDENNGYVHKSFCDERSGNTGERLDDLQKDMRELLRRIPPP